MPEDEPLHLKEQLAYNWDLHNKKLEKVWMPAINPPSSFRALADKVAAEKAAKTPLHGRKRRGIIKDT